MTDPTESSLKAQLRTLAGQLYPTSEHSDVLARALFALKRADTWLTEQVDELAVEMRSSGNTVRRIYTSPVHRVEVSLEAGADLRVTGAVEPAAAGWVLVVGGRHRELARLDEHGMFSVVLPEVQDAIDLVLEFDDGVTLTLKGVEGQAP